jgi:hypothetical protein
MMDFGGKCKECGKISMSVEPVLFPVGRTGNLETVKYKSVSLCTKCTDVLFAYMADITYKWENESEEGVP